MDLVVCLALYSYSDFLNSSILLKKHDILLFPSNRTFPCFDSRVVYVNNGLGFVVCVCSFLYLQDGRHLNEMTTSLLVELEFDDQRQLRPVLFSQMQVFSFLVDDCTEFLCVSSKEKTLPENVCRSKECSKFLCG